MRAAGRKVEVGHQAEFPRGEGHGCQALGHLQGMWWSCLLLLTGQPNLGIASQEQLKTQSQEPDGPGLSLRSATHQPGNLEQVF